MGDFGLSLVKLGKYEDEEGSKCGQYSELGVGARSVAADARRVGLAAVRQSRLGRLANSQIMEALEPLHDELAMSPVGGRAGGWVGGWAGGWGFAVTASAACLQCPTWARATCLLLSLSRLFPPRCGSGRRRC